MFEAITSEQLPDGTTLAHYCPADMPGGYVAFQPKPWATRVRAVNYGLGGTWRISGFRHTCRSPIRTHSFDYLDPPLI